MFMILVFCKFKYQTRFAGLYSQDIKHALLNSKFQDDIWFFTLNFIITWKFYIKIPISKEKFYQIF